ncbi:TonB-dependent receptor [Wenyingzhuangia sp. 2_MG-2023]|uniref:TonB-dependent receptor n=1 Tax=Wenyingzhuangia sp. 2_MG-2023 TaxID=3062639 RepID=UPI0026E21996|nr:TonB-dependent receptor [Wenyingzhuangia sp. 2_MG-2023]MDO6736557.1 TonB-dependent receptor [Wenyingzhuangia sp. 2_MG-2023]MDO6801148.1 TonB-dependent receptor [Wenyingzhuangia sp. 1_MG-2023]
MRNLLVTFFTLLTVFTYAQSKGTISGTVQDKDMDLEPLPLVSIYVEGNPQLGTSTDFDGIYQLQLNPGSYTLVYDFVGYKTVKKPIVVKAGVTQKIVIVMESQADALDTVMITAVTTKESESALMQVQKEATVVIESVGAEQLSSQGVSDAAAATTKVTGVSKQQGSSDVYVRGLGDRYNSTTLNGLPLPSNNPSNKNISLDLFSTDVLQNVGISKTFSSGVTGDLGGANINVETKQPSTKPNFAIGISTGANSQTTFKDFKTIDGANYLGIQTNTEQPITNLKNYNFGSKISPNASTALPKIGLSLNGGKKYRFKDDSSFSYFLVGSFGNSYRFQDGINVSHRNATSQGSNFYDAKEYSYSASKLAMGNFEYAFNSNHKILFNSVFIHSNSQKIQDYYGDTNDNNDVNLMLQTESQDKLLVNQLISKNEFGEYLDLDLGLAYNNVKNDQPDRKKNVLIFDDPSGKARFSTGTARENSRYFQNLNENDLVANLSAKVYLGKRGAEETKGSIGLGASYRNTTRDFKAWYFDHNALSSSKLFDPNDLSAVLNQQALDRGDFDVRTGRGFASNALDPFTYDGDKTVNTAHVNLDYNLSDNFFISIGGRLEDITMDVNWDTNLSSSGTTLNNTYILPSLNLKYSLNDENQFRFSASKTYTYPQFKEIAEFVYEGANYTEQGNGNLQPSDNYNLDIKYEFFPENGGLISASVFGKMIQNSINRIEINSASDNAYSYENTGDAKVVGLEVEYKTTLATFGDDTSEDFSKIKFGANATYMHTTQDLKTRGLFRPTNSTSQLQGASPIIVNGDISYVFTKNDRESMATLVVNYQGDKLYSIGTNSGSIGLEDVIQKAITTLDFVAKHSFNDKMSLKISLKNILNPSFKRVRNLDTPLTNVSYKRGVDFGVSLGYKF